MKGSVLSLFDFTGTAVEPWRKAGYDCWIVDFRHRYGTRKHVKKEGVVEVGVDLRHGWFPPPELKNVVFMSAFPPCTHVSVSGAKHFLKKGPRALSSALDMFATAKELGEWLGVPYFIENPISTFSTYCGKPDYSFHPCDFGGYLPEDDKHPRYSKYFPPRDAYFKKTCLWTGGGFIMPKEKRVEPGTKDALTFSQLGGNNSRETEFVRDITPRGFSQAVFESNCRKKNL